MKAGSIELLDGIYKNAFNLILGAQGRGKTFHAEELIRANAGHFADVKRFAPGGSCGGGQSGDANALVQYLNERVRKAETQRHDCEMLDTLKSALIQGNPRFAFERGVTKEDLEDLMKRYPSHKNVGELEPELILIDDMGGDPRIKMSQSLFNDVARRLRHLQLTILFNGHQYKDLSPFVRANTQVAYLHGGLPIKDMKELCVERRIPNVRTYRDLEGFYNDKTMGNDKFYDYLTLDFYGKMPPEPENKNVEGSAGGL